MVQLARLEWFNLPEAEFQLGC